jgi:hypothetical protein
MCSELYCRADGVGSSFNDSQEPGVLRRSRGVMWSHLELEFLGQSQSHLYVSTIADYKHPIASALAILYFLALVNYLIPEPY